MKRDEIIFRKILRFCNESREAINHFGNDYAIFKESSVYRNAVSMCILQIGELCKLLSLESRQNIPNVPWKQWCGIRDVFAHQYENVDLESEWDTIQNDLPKLKTEISHYLGRN